MSLPGDPNGMKSLPSLNESAGFGVRRGRLPGASAAGCAGSVHDCDPRDEGHRPVPGITGVALEPSLGVVEQALPLSSTTHAYEVSASGTGSPGVGWGRGLACGKLFTSPAGGISFQASEVRNSLRRTAAYLSHNSTSSGTSMESGTTEERSRSTNQSL